MSSDYVYTMYRADKFYGADRQVLANISLSFLPGAKIGVLGPNGAGKSTLLRIMAGKEEPSSGVAELATGATVGTVTRVETGSSGNVRKVKVSLSSNNKIVAIPANYLRFNTDKDTLKASLTRSELNNLPST